MCRIAPHFVVVLCALASPGLGAQEEVAPGTPIVAVVIDRHDV
jgi:hypothetical protein